MTWTKLVAFDDQPALARLEIATFRYQVLHVAVQRQLRLPGYVVGRSMSSRSSTVGKSRSQRPDGYLLEKSYWL